LETTIRRIIPLIHHTVNKYSSLKNKITSVAILFLVVVNLQTNAQNTVLKKNVAKQNERNERALESPNGKFFTSTFYGVSFILPVMENDSMAIRNNLSSHQLYFGSRYKLKLNEYFALGADLLYMRHAFRIKQDSSTNLLSLGQLNNKQRLAFHNLGLGIHLRINFNKRGDYLGKYLDLGAESQYVIGERLFTRNNVDPNLNGGASTIRLNQSKLDYTESLQHFVVVRLGWSKILLSARYRISDIFIASGNINGGSQLPELPRFSIGLEMNVWKNSSQRDDSMDE